MLPTSHQPYRRHRRNSSSRYPFLPSRWTPKTILTSFLLIITVLYIVYVGRRDRWVRDFGYLTRPIWDKGDEAPQLTINHYALTDPAAGELCSVHGWSDVVHHNAPLNPKVFDAFIFSVELDLIEIRMRELLPVVDRFVILESTRAFSGALRTDLNVFKNARASGRFAFAEHKIHHALIEDFDPNPSSPWVNEARMRRHMNSLLRDAGVHTGDIVLMSDVDELPSARTVRLLKECAGWPSPLHLNMRNFIYSFEFPLADGGYWRAKAVRYIDANDTPYGHGKSSENVLANSGWHCSWCFRYLEDFQFKMTGYSHNDRVKSSLQLSEARITKHTCNGSDIFDMLPEAYTFKELLLLSGGASRATSFTEIPDWVVRNSAEFAFLLPGGCARPRRPT